MCHKWKILENLGMNFRRNFKDLSEFYSMADADWGWGFGPNNKRSPRITKRFRDFGSMADADWGWGFGPIHKKDQDSHKISKRFFNNHKKSKYFGETF